MATVQFKNINKVYENNVQAVFDFNLNVNDKEFIVLVGPSGCGKSTTLRMLAGLENITEGEILIDDVVVNDLPPKSRDIAMVFQSYALYPHMTVYENMAFALKIKGLSKQEIEERVNYAADILALRPYLNRKPKALSGGQRQRVALGRAIVRTPKVFLMDEPLSNLDAKLRVQMRSEIAKIHQKVGAITIYVTHDQTEAMTMADRIVVMKDGYIQQIGTPREVYNYPTNIFVGGFIGSPAMNFMNGVSDGKEFIIPNENTGDIRIKLPKDKVETLKNYVAVKIENLKQVLQEENTALNEVEEKLATLKPKSKDFVASSAYQKELQDSINVHIELLKKFESGVFPLVLGIRPEHLSIVREASDLNLICEISELLGKESIMYTYANGQRLIIVANANEEVTQGNSFNVKIDFDKIHMFDQETTMRIK